MIIIDSREKFKDKWKKFFEKEKLECRIEALPVGDFLVEEKGVCVERKSMGDFIGSYISGHMHNQLIEMNNNFDIYWLFISGTFSEWKRFKGGARYPHIKTDSFHKMTIHLMHDFKGLRIEQFESDRQLLLGIKEIMKYKGKPIFKINRTSLTLNDVYMNVLLALPGISTTRAIEIKKRCPTLTDFALDLKHDEIELKGLTKIQKALIKKTFKEKTYI